MVLAGADCRSASVRVALCPMSTGRGAKRRGNSVGAGVALGSGEAIPLAGSKAKASNARCAMILCSLALLAEVPARLGGLKMRNKRSRSRIARSSVKVEGLGRRLRVGGATEDDRVMLYYPGLPATSRVVLRVRLLRQTSAPASRRVILILVSSAPTRLAYGGAIASDRTHRVHRYSTTTSQDLDCSPLARQRVVAVS